MSFQAEAVVDLDVVAANVATLSGNTNAALMPSVKANAYGHGLVPTARACLAGGATRLGVATLNEAMSLRDNGITVPILAWLVAPGLDVAGAIDANVELAVGSVEQLEAFADARASGPARIHLKADTGMGRGGAVIEDWWRLTERAATAQANGRVEVVGAFSHLACADEPGHPANEAQLTAFAEFLEVVSAAGLEPEMRHLANSAGMLSDTRTHYDLVRPGIAVYGYNPIPGNRTALRPAMTLRTTLVLVKNLPAGHGIGYGHTYVTPRPERVAIAPLGYADGIHRMSSNRAEVLINRYRCPVRGRVSMDQVVVGLDGAEAAPGDVAEFFGPDGGISAADWAAWSDTLIYEILTSIGPRVLRRYVGDAS